jgi:hypothetical protein
MRNKMEQTLSEQQALKQVVENLKRAVLEQEKRIGYIYWRHNEKDRTNKI